MKRPWLLVLVVGMIMALAAPVAAAPPDCSEKPDHPSCPLPDDLDGGTVCDTEAPKTGDFDITLGGGKTHYPDGACVDVLSDEGPWYVTVDVQQGSVRELRLFLRDSVGPGDGCFEGGSCGLVLRDLPTDPIHLAPSMNVDDAGSMPGAYVNACGTVFAEVHDGVSYDAVRDDIPSPLAFMPSIRASRDAVVVLRVSPPQYTGD
jgi:hypothetical protein